MIEPDTDNKINNSNNPKKAFPSSFQSFNASCFYVFAAKHKTGCIFVGEEELMMIKLFGITKEIIGSTKLSVDTSDTIHTVGDLKVWLSHQYPSLKGLKSLAVAVDSEYANDAVFISNSSEVALIPPVSGG